MADIDIQRKKTPWPWIIGIIVAIVIIWALFQIGDDAETEAVVAAPAVDTPAAAPVEAAPPPAATEPTPAITAVAMPPPPTAADNTAIPVATIVVGPTQYLGQPVVGTAQVADVVSDRGFWIEQDGQRIFAMVARSAAMEDAIDLNPGQRIRLAGVVYDRSMVDQISGGIDAGTMDQVADQPAFLLVDASNIVLIGE